MQARALLAAVLLTVLSWAPAAYSCPCGEIPKPEAKAPPMDRLAGLKFMETPEYKAEFDAAIAGARAACEAHKGEPNVAIVSDIDETILNNAPEFKDHPDWNWKQFGYWIDGASAETLKPTADFIAWARQQGYAIFLITGRTEDTRRPTILNLVRDGVVYDGLYMRAPGDSRPAEQMKTEYRKKIEDMGFKIIVSIGDQYSDLYGGHAVDCEKLPNRIYYIP